MSNTIKRTRARRTPSTPSRATTAGGFTLVELLVVIGIIALLIGILLPTLSRARESGNQIKCMANLRTIGQAMVMYAGENKGSLPFGFVVQNDPIQGGIYRGETTDWTVLLMNVLNKKLGTGYDSTTIVGGYKGVRATFACPSVHVDPNVATVFTHYSAHPRIMPDLTGTDNYKGSPNRLVGYKIARIKRASEIAVIFDASLFNPSGPGQNIATACAFALDRFRLSRPPFLVDDYSRDPAIEPNQPVDLTPFVGGTGSEQNINTDKDQNKANIRFRHKGDTQANALMMDGHVETFTFNKSSKTTSMLRKNIYVSP